MDVNSTNTNNPQDKKISSLLVFVIIAVFAVAGVLVAQNKFFPKSASKENQQELSGNIDDATNESAPFVENSVYDNNDEAVEQTPEPTTIEVQGGSFYFNPNEIRVKQGQEVKIIFTNVDGFHDFVLDEFNVRTDQITAGNTVEVTFIADKAGTYEFYCSIGEHRAMGMVGTLVVEE